MSNHGYGECHVCGEHMKEKRVKQDLWLKGKLLVIDGVPTGVCPQCGARVVRAEVGRAIAALIRDTGRRQKARRVSVPVIRFAKEIA